MTHALIAAITDHLATAGRASTARRRARSWATQQPLLAGFASPAEVADAVRRARLAHQDRYLHELLAVAVDDEWAQLTILASLAPRMGWIVAAWSRHVHNRQELADLEATLVAETWTAILDATATPPDRPGLSLVDAAWSRVRTDRRRQRRHQDKIADQPLAVPVTASSPPALDRLASAVTDAVRVGRLGLGPARVVYLTRVFGLSTAKAAALLGCQPTTIRMQRSRAERRLTA